METEKEGTAGEVDLCPSCGAQIAPDAVRCGFCKANLGRCSGCGTWVIAGTRCLECGRVATVAMRAPAVRGEGCDFDGPALPLLIPLAVRSVLLAGTAGALAMALAASGVSPARKLVHETGLELSVPMPALWGVAAALYLSVGIASGFIRRYRFRHTFLFGERLDFRPGRLGWLWTPIANLLVLAFTAGLGVPWIYARNRRVQYRSCAIPPRGSRSFDFVGTGEEVMGYGLLTLLCIPLVLATGGFLGALPSWLWVRWEQRNLLVPDRGGRLKPVGFAGTLGGYFGRWVLGWFLTLLTAGLYRPWAKTAEWRWIARNTEVS